MMPTIRIDDDVMKVLQAQAQAFVDTPNSVLRRILEIDKPPVKKNPLPLPHARITPTTAYEPFLLVVLSKMPDSAGAKDVVVEEVVNEMKSRLILTSADMERVSTGETRSENKVAWARNSLREQGQITADSSRGVWKLTEAGLERARSISLDEIRKKSSFKL